MAPTFHDDRELRRYLRLHPYPRSRRRGQRSHFPTDWPADMGRRCRRSVVYDGRGLAANLVYGAQAVWVGTRFVASEEAGATRAHKAALLSADHGDVVRTLIYSGRPLRVRRTPYVDDWENNRQAEIKELTAKGIVPNEHEVDKHPEKSIQAVTFLMGDVATLIKDILPARTIVDNMVNDAAKILQDSSTLVSVKTKL